MDIADLLQAEGAPAITWARVISYARQLECAAKRNGVTPEEGSRLVRLLLDFDRHLVGGDFKVARAKLAT